MPILAQEPVLYPPSLLTEFAEVSSDPSMNDFDETEKQVWWAVFTRARQEKALARQLYAYNIPFYLPLVPHQHLYRGRKVKSYLPLFSGYLFMFSNNDQRIAALATNRISRMLPVGDEDRLRRDLLQIHQLIEAKAAMTVEQRIQPGRQVRIKCGAMKGVEGLVIERRGGNRLLVVVDYIQQGVSVAIEDFMVEPI